MSEINGMTDAELIAKTRDFEADIRKSKTGITRFQNDIKGLDRVIKENKEKLTMSTQLPHMVANVGEILDAEDDEDDEKDGFK
jgi:26S proteasome regulatory subunit T5